VQEALSRELEAISSKLYVFLSRRASGKIGPSVILNELQDTNCGQHDNVWQEVIGQGPLYKTGYVVIQTMEVFLLG
jgi:hypothetical protein